MNEMNFFCVAECPESTDGAKQYYCPSLNSEGRHVCIDGKGKKVCCKILKTRSYSGLLVISQLF